MTWPNPDALKQLTSSTSDTKETTMHAAILTDEQSNFLLGILSHDTDMVEPLVRDTDLSFDTEDDTDIIALRDLMGTTVNALMGRLEVGQHEVHPFHGTRETSADAFVIDLDRSLDEGPNVLTCTQVRHEAFMGFIYGEGVGTYVEVPKRLGNALADCIELATDDADAANNIGIDMNDMEDVDSFVATLRRLSSTASFVTKREQPKWDIVNPDGSVAYWCEASDEIAALDRWVRETQPDMADYTSTLQQHVLEGHDGGLPVYRHEGVIYAIHTNYEVRVMPHTEVAPTSYEIVVALGERDADEVQAIATDLQKKLGDVVVREVS